MNKHTPGPWKFRDDSKVFKTNPFSVYIKGRGVHSAAIANIPRKQTIFEEEALANALLIAAAPELLAALQGLLKGIFDGPDDSDAAMLIAKARDAVNKATGA
jgi:hypothetical protein